MTSSTDMIRMFLSNLAMHLPMMIVIVVGLVMALHSWRRNPKASMWAAIGFGIMLVANLANVIFYATIPRWASNHSSIATIMTIASTGFSLIFALSMSFVVAAIFADRGPRGS